jgi:site-specific DNA-methyltransferase (adenine-specific)
MKLTDKITITNEDNMELMARYPDNYFDLAIVDPPYKEEVEGLKVGFNRSNFNYEALSTPPTKDYIKELFRVSNNQIMWGFNYYLELLPNTDSVVFWNKHQNGHFAEGELAWCSVGKTRIYDRAYQKDIGNKIHPTQKPVKLYEWLLDNYAKEGDKILDTHLGSGSIAIACHNRKFELTACELDEDYYKASIKRIQDHISQLTIF